MTQGETCQRTSLDYRRNFDQIISIKTPRQTFTDEDLAKGMRIEFSNRGTSKERLKEKDKALGRLHIPGGAPRPSGVETVREFYFEEGELFVPPIFDATPEEKSRAPSSS